MIDVRKIPVQARLTEDDLALLDKLAAKQAERSGGAEISRAEALRVAALVGARALLRQWEADARRYSGGKDSVYLSAEDALAKAEEAHSTSRSPGAHAFRAQAEAAKAEEDEYRQQLPMATEAVAPRRPLRQSARGASLGNCANMVTSMKAQGKVCAISRAIVSSV